MTTDDPLVRVKNLKKHFPVSQGLLLMKTVGHVQAVDGIRFDIKRGVRKLELTHYSGRLSNFLVVTDQRVGVRRGG